MKRYVFAEMDVAPKNGQLMYDIVFKGGYIITDPRLYLYLRDLANKGMVIDYLKRLY